MCIWSCAPIVLKFHFKRCFLFLIYVRYVFVIVTVFTFTGQQAVNAIQDALSQLGQDTNGCFETKPVYPGYEGPYLNFYPGEDGCHSPVGRTVDYGPQKVSIIGTSKRFLNDKLTICKVCQTNNLAIDFAKREFEDKSQLITVTIEVLPNNKIFKNIPTSCFTPRIVRELIQIEISYE